MALPPGLPLPGTRPGSASALLRSQLTHPSKLLSPIPGSPSELSDSFQHLFKDTVAKPTPAGLESAALASRSLTHMRHSSLPMTISLGDTGASANASASANDGQRGFLPIPKPMDGRRVVSDEPRADYAHFTPANRFSTGTLSKADACGDWRTKPGATAGLEQAATQLTVSSASRPDTVMSIDSLFSKFNTESEVGRAGQGDSPTMKTATTASRVSQQIPADTPLGNAPANPPAARARPATVMDSGGHTPSNMFGPKLKRSPLAQTTRIPARSTAGLPTGPTPHKISRKPVPTSARVNISGKPSIDKADKPTPKKTASKV